LAITISDNAKDKIFSLLKQRQTPDHYLKISMQGGGCSGLIYHYEFVDNPGKKDKIFEFDNVKICVDLKSYLFLNNMEIDYEEDLFKSGLIFNNPNMTKSCGCGKSVNY